MTNPGELHPVRIRDPEDLRQQKASTRDETAPPPRPERRAAREPQGGERHRNHDVQRRDMKQHGHAQRESREEPSRPRRRLSRHHRNEPQDKAGQDEEGRRPFRPHAARIPDHRRVQKVEDERRGGRDRAAREPPRQPRQQHADQDGQHRRNPERAIREPGRDGNGHQQGVCGEEPRLPLLHLKVLNPQAVVLGDEEIPVPVSKRPLLFRGHFREGRVLEIEMPVAGVGNRRVEIRARVLARFHLFVGPEQEARGPRGEEEPHPSRDRAHVQEPEAGDEHPRNKQREKHAHQQGHIGDSIECGSSIKAQNNAMAGQNLSAKMPA